MEEAFKSVGFGRWGMAVDILLVNQWFRDLYWLTIRFAILIYTRTKETHFFSFFRYIFYSSLRGESHIGGATGYLAGGESCYSPDSISSSVSDDMDMAGLSMPVVLFMFDRLLLDRLSSEVKVYDSFDGTLSFPAKKKTRYLSMLLLILYLNCWKAKCLLTSSFQFITFV